MLTIRLIRPPSTTIEFGTCVSRPPSVAVPPVRGTTLMPCSFAKASTAAASAVDPTRATAAGGGSVKTPKMLSSLRKLSMLRSRSSCSSVTTCSAPRISTRPSTIASLLNPMGGVPRRLVEDRVGPLEHGVRAVANGGGDSLVDPCIEGGVGGIGCERLATLARRHPRGGHLDVGIDAGADGSADRRAEAGAGLDDVPRRRDPEDVREDLQEERAPGAAAGDHDLLEADPELAAHGIDGVLHRQRDRLEDRAVDVPARVPCIEAEHHPLAKLLVGRRQPVEHGQEAVAPGRDEGSLLLDQLLAREPEHGGPLCQLGAEQVEEPRQRPHAAADAVALVEV